MTDKTPAMPEFIRVLVKVQGGEMHSTEAQFMSEEIGYLVGVPREWQPAALQSAQPAVVSDAEIMGCIAEHEVYQGRPGALLHFARAILALRPQAVPMTDEQVRVVRFLLGESALEDCHFGDMHPDKRGRFWWRESLRNAFGITAQGAQAVPMTDAEKFAAWKAATIELPSPENCYLRGLVDAEAHHGITAQGAQGEQA